MTKASFEDLQNKPILVTGGNRGIGKEICMALAKQKAHVIFSYRNDDNMAMLLKEELTLAGASKVDALKFDVSNASEVSTAINKFLKEGNTISGLVNNAGISVDKLVLRLKEEDIHQTIDINLKGSIFVTQALTKNFMKVSNPSIVNVSSVVGLMGNLSQTIYASSKAGLIGFTKSYAKEMASKSVRCNAICPGLIETDMTNALNDKAKENYLSLIPLRKIGKADDVASLTCFLLSEASSYITGETIKIDGGLYI